MEFAQKLGHSDLIWNTLQEVQITQVAESLLKGNLFREMQDLLRENWKEEWNEAGYAADVDINFEPE